MKKWITLTVDNTSGRNSEFDADSIIGFGPRQSETNQSTIYLSGGAVVNVVESTAAIRSKINAAK